MLFIRFQHYILLIGGAVLILAGAFYSGMGLRLFLAIAGLALIGWNLVRLVKATQESMEMYRSNLSRHENERTVRMMSRYRHDWMNEFQLLIGYLRLKKYDRVDEFVRQVIHKAKEESVISQLGDIELVSYLLGFNANHHELQLEIVVDDSFRAREGNQLGSVWTNAIIQAIETYRSNALDNQWTDNILKIELSCCPEVTFSFTYSGNLNVEGWKQQYKGLLYETAKASSIHIREDHAERLYMNWEEAIG